MITRKTLSFAAIYGFSGHHLLWLISWMAIVAATYYFTGWKFITIPWVPLALIGTAVAFYVGFKNNQSYDRLWEARKIWGAMVNSSRMLAVMIKNFRDENSQGVSGPKRKEFVYRHIAYLYQLRRQLLEPTQWEHVSLTWRFGSFNRMRRDGINDTFHSELKEIEEQEYLTEAEKASLEGFKNKATQLLDIQTALVQELYASKEINLMQQMELQRAINDFYAEQGKAERIKRFPFPRQYATFSFVFVCIFVFLLPFGIVGELSKLGDDMVWLTIPLGTVVGWIYVVMEMTGDYSENPFEGLWNDVPMLSICRTIEIDMLQIMGESDVPEPVTAKGGILI